MKVPCKIAVFPVSVILKALLAVVFVGAIVFCVAEWHIANDLMFVTGGATKDSVHRYFADQGRSPIFILKKGDCIPRVGWPIPIKAIDYEMEVYDSAVAVRIYIYYDKNGDVSYVFSSSS